MQKLLLSVIMALLLALTLVSLKRLVGPSATGKSNTTLMATGGPAPAPIPW